MDALRKVYHRAVQIPLENVEVLWKDYEAFENGLNKITVRECTTRAHGRSIPNPRIEMTNHAPCI